MIEIKEYIISLLKKTRSKIIVSSFSDVTLKNDSILIETKKELIEIYRSEILPILEKKLKINIILVGI
jgi:hypothetical protein